MLFLATKFVVISYSSYCYCCCCLVAKSPPALCSPIDCSPPGSSVHGILQARILEWVAFPPPGDLPNPGMEPGHFHCRQILYCLSHNWKCQLLEIFCRRRKWKLRDSLGLAQGHHSWSPSSPRPVARPTAPTPLPSPQGTQRFWGQRG